PLAGRRGDQASPLTGPLAATGGGWRLSASRSRRRVIAPALAWVRAAAGRRGMARGGDGWSEGTCDGGGVAAWRSAVPGRVPDRAPPGRGRPGPRLPGRLPVR